MTKHAEWDWPGSRYELWRYRRQRAIEAEISQAIFDSIHPPTAFDRAFRLMLRR